MVEISDELLRFVLYGRLRSPFEQNYHFQGVLPTFFYSEPTGRNYLHANTQVRTEILSD